MDDSLRRMSEYFGPGYRVLNVHFTRMDAKQEADATLGGFGEGAVSTSRDLATTQSARPKSWKHPIPRRLGLSGVGGLSARRRRARLASGRKASFHLQQTPVFLAAAGIALSLVLAMTLPAQKIRRATALEFVRPRDCPTVEAESVLFSAVCDRWDYAPLSKSSW
ncbi:MAG: hypothetical protein LLF97_10975 [Planctomycetaceae bacterium]|nr:hypothetical protein [Planctomycetaceae bacterium]